MRHYTQLLPQPGGEHLCYTLSISTSLAAILVGCELVFEKPQQCHLVTLTEILELHLVGIVMQSAHFLRPLGLSIGFLLGDFLFFMPIVQRHAAIHTLTGAQGDPNSVTVSLDDFIKNGRVGEVSLSCFSQPAIWR